MSSKTKMFKRMEAKMKASRKKYIPGNRKMRSCTTNRYLVRSRHPVDEVPLISMRGYAVSSEDTTAKMSEAQKSLKEARKLIIHYK